MQYTKTMKSFPIIVRNFRNVSVLVSNFLIGKSFSENWQLECSEATNEHSKAIKPHF